MKLGKRSFTVSNDVYFRSGYTIVGPKEGLSNLGKEFDVVLGNDLWNENSYEKCECKMHREAVAGAVQKAGLDYEDVDIMLAGDLLNELSASSFAARAFPTAFLGLYNACSTFGESLLVGSMLLSGGFANVITCSTSSHFASAERQYRYPLELGNQRTPTAQWTVTGAGCSVLTTQKPDSAYKVRVEGGTIGRVVDMGVDDESNMGAAMAPAAADTIAKHLEEFNRNPDYYDCVFTGDLGRFGDDLLRYLLKDRGIDLGAKYMDCGAWYYTPEQKTHQGGSGAGCVSTAFNSRILRLLSLGELRRILLVPTGALLNKDTPLQKETIPSIAHAVSITSSPD